MELIKKERNKTSGRQLGQENGRGYVPSARSKTSGRDSGRGRDQERRALDPAEGRRPDSGDKYQVDWFS